jgi:hypothetical protein
MAAGASGAAAAEGAAPGETPGELANLPDGAAGTPGEAPPPGPEAESAPRSLGNTGQRSASRPGPPASGNLADDRPSSGTPVLALGAIAAALLVVLVKQGDEEPLPNTP